MALKVLRRKDFIEAVKTFEPKAVFQKRRGFVSGFHFQFRINDGRTTILFNTGYKHDDAEILVEELKKMKIPILFVVSA